MNDTCKISTWLWILLLQDLFELVFSAHILECWWYKIILIFFRSLFVLIFFNSRHTFWSRPLLNRALWSARRCFVLRLLPLSFIQSYVWAIPLISRIDTEFRIIMKYLDTKHIPKLPVLCWLFNFPWWIQITQRNFTVHVIYNNNYHSLVMLYNCMPVLLWTVSHPWKLKQFIYILSMIPQVTRYRSWA